MFGDSGHCAVLCAYVCAGFNGQAVGFANSNAVEIGRTEAARERIACANRVGNLHFGRF